jgi:hypothetical protein
MTEAELATVLRELAFEAGSLRKSLRLCADAGLSLVPLGRPLVECTISDLQKLAVRAEALAELVVLSYAGSDGE